MVRGLYTAASGMLAQSKKIDVLSNNMANSKTAGYKGDFATFEAFGNGETIRFQGAYSAALGATVNGAAMAQIGTHYDQGAVEQTGSSLDFAIEGAGYFTLEQPDGTRFITRNGQFNRREDGYLTDYSGNLVLGTNGPVYLERSDIEVTPTGEILSGGATAGNLLITNPATMEGAEKLPGAGFTLPAGGAQDVFTGVIRQGALERSNIDLIEQMTSLVESSRAFQTCSRVVQMMDGILEKSVTQIGSL